MLVRQHQRPLARHLGLRGRGARQPDRADRPAAQPRGADQLLLQRRAPRDRDAGGPRRRARARSSVGRSMRRMIDAAREVGYLQDMPPIRRRARGRACCRATRCSISCTGSQGEARSALTRIAAGQHPRVQLEPGDTVIFSAKIIPGNERTLYNLHNQLVRPGIEVITEGDHFVHVSGHPCRDELEQMYRWIKPKIAVPVHGEARHLHAHQRLAQQMGVPHALLIENGDVLRLAPGNARGDRRGAGRAAGGRDRRPGRHRRRAVPHPPPADEPRHDPGRAWCSTTTAACWRRRSSRPSVRSSSSASASCASARAEAVDRRDRGARATRRRATTSASARRRAAPSGRRSTCRGSGGRSSRCRSPGSGADVLAAFEPEEETVP